MTDDKTDPVVEETKEEVVADEPSQPEPEKPEEQAPAEEVKEEEEAPSEESEPAEEPEEQPPSRREQLRIQKLLQKYGDPRQPTSQPSRRDALDYDTALDADPEVIRQLEADRQAEGISQYNEGLKRAEFLNWHTSLKIDAPNIEKKFPILDESSPEFHPAVANAINSWYTNMSGFDPETATVSNPNISYADFVEGFMELVQETAGEKNAQSVQNIAKQAASTGLRPDGSSAKRLNLNRPAEEMTDEELYASIGNLGKKP